LRLSLLLVIAEAYFNDGVLQLAVNQSDTARCFSPIWYELECLTNVQPYSPKISLDFCIR